MALRADIDALLDRTDLTVEQKAAQLDQLIVDGFLPVMQGRVGQTFTRGNLSVTLTGAAAYPEADRTWLAVSIIARRNGALVPVDNPILFREPPVGEVGDAADLIAWATQIVLDVIS